MKISEACLLFLLGPVLSMAETAIPPDHPLLLKVEELARARAASTKPVYALRCRPVTTLIGVLPTSTKAVGTDTLPFRLEQSAYYLKDVYALLEMTATGKDSLMRFKRRAESGELKVEQITNEGEKRCPKQALACYFPSKRILYVDKSAELGTLAPVLFHEILHALDEELALALKEEAALGDTFRAGVIAAFEETARRRSKDPAQLAVSDFAPAEVERLADLKAMAEEVSEVAGFRTERVAYDGGAQIAHELKALFPHYYKDRRLASLPGNPTDAQIVESYGLSAPLIGKFLRGACKEVR